MMYISAYLILYIIKLEFFETMVCQYFSGHGRSITKIKTGLHN